MSAGHLLVRHNPEKNDTESQRTQEIPTDKREVEKKETHTLTIHQNLAEMVSIADTDVGVILYNKREKAYFVEVHNHRNQRDEEEESATAGIDDKIQGFEEAEKSVFGVNTGKISQVKRDVEERERDGNQGYAHNGTCDGETGGNHDKEQHAAESATIIGETIREKRVKEIGSRFTNQS